MSKDDIEIPSEIPRKRRQLEAALDSWVAFWLSGEPTPSQRRRLEEERERRKRLRRAQSRVVAVIVGPEGQTPEQKAAITEALTAAQDTVLRPPIVAAKSAIRSSDLVIAAPRESAAPSDVQIRDRSSVWHAIDYAKHRRVPVRIIMPNGKEGNL